MKLGTANRKINKFNAHRKHTRFNLENNTLYYKYHKTPIKCDIINISESGMMLKINQAFIVGDIIDLLFDMSYYIKSKTLQAKVCHINGQYAGFNFIINNDEDKQIINDYIETKLGEKFKKTFNTKKEL